MEGGEEFVTCFGAAAAPTTDHAVIDGTTKGIVDEGTNIGGSTTEEEEDENIEIYYSNTIGNNADCSASVDPYVDVDLESLILGVESSSKLHPRHYYVKPVKSETTSEDEMDEEEADWTLDTLPVEVFLQICSFLDAGNLIRTVSLVCKRFHAIISNETTWKIRQTQRWYRNGNYPPVKLLNEDEFRWSVACLKREEQIKLWGNNGTNLRHVELNSHIGCVDAVHLFNSGEFLVSGSRDRSLNIYKVESCFSGSSSTNPSTVPGLILHKEAAHKGWIWSFATNPSYLFSGSWDNTLKCWDRNSNFNLVTEYKTGTPCLCLTAMENLMAAGTFDAKVLLFDPRVRANSEPVNTYRQHKKAVLAIGMDENHVISCGEDGRIIKYDLKAGKVQKIIALQRPAYPTCFSFRREDPASLFYIGDKLGNLYLVDSNAFKIVKKYPAIHTRAIQGVYHGLGSVFTCSSDGNMKTFEPSSGLHELSSIHVNSELPDVHSLNNIVALAGGEGVVRLYAPMPDFYS